MMHAQRKQRMKHGSPRLPNIEGRQTQATGRIPIHVALDRPYKDEQQPSTMILRSGFSVMAYRSFTEDVLGQIHRNKLNLGGHQNCILRMLPAIEEGLCRHDFLYEHSGLGPQHSNHMSVVSREGMLYRLAIIPPCPDGTEAALLHMDTAWIEKDDPVKEHEYRAALPMGTDTRPSNIHDFIGRVPR